MANKAGKWTAVLLAGSLVLAGCTGPDDREIGVQVMGGYGEEPEIRVSDQDARPPKDLVVNVISPGNSDNVVDSGEFVLANYLGQTWALDEDGDVNVVDNSFATGKSVGFPLGAGAVIPGWERGLVGQRVGSRVLLSIPPKMGYGDRAISRVPAGSTLLYVFDLIAAYGADDAPPGRPVAGLPTDLPIVAGDVGEEPTITFSSSAKTVTKSDAVLLVEGEGEPFRENLVVQEVAASYSTGKVINSTWSSAPVALTVDQLDLLPGLARALSHAKVGSRALVRVSVADNTDEPMDMMGMGVPPQPTPGDPLVIVVDVIGTF